MPTKRSEQDSLADDLLVGAAAIAKFIYRDGKKRRRIYELAVVDGPSKFPSFRLGGIICARRSTLLAWIEGQEKGL